jgi:ankyrin repeat protein
LKDLIKEKYKLSNIEILIYLFENVFGPDFLLKEQLSAFHLFAKFGQIEAIAYCLKLGISPNYKTSITYTDYPSATALHIAAGYNQLELC